MFQQLRRSIIIVFSLGLLLVAVIAPGVSSAAITAAPQAAPTVEFLLSITYRAPYESGYLLRGDNRLLYMQGFYGWSWGENWGMVISRNGWTGTVNLQALNLPAAVTSELPATVFVPKYGSARFSLHLRAAITAPITTTTVTVRASSGSIVKTEGVLFTIVDQLPPLPTH